METNCLVVQQPILLSLCCFIALCTILQFFVDISCVFAVVLCFPNKFSVSTVDYESLRPRAGQYGKNITSLVFSWQGHNLDFITML